MAAAACQVARSLYRSVAALRSGLDDAAIVTPLLACMRSGHPDVQAAAAAALCNVVLDFSPLKVRPAH